jgi:ubiquinone/menaquinone biosynthesis C-methylase UbiE
MSSASAGFLTPSGRPAGGKNLFFADLPAEGRDFDMIDFDARAREWDADPVKVERARTIAEAIAERVPLSPHMTALEYGCGTGVVGFALQPFLGRITLADSSQGMLRVLREKLAASDIRNMEPRALDLVADPMPQERFDLVYSAMTLHHIPDTALILSRFHALLNPSGYLCIADLDHEDGSFHGPDFEGHHGFDREELAERATRAGFEDITFATVFEVVKEAGGKPRPFPVFLMTARRKGSDPGTARRGE